MRRDNDTDSCMISVTGEQRDRIVTMAHKPMVGHVLAGVSAAKSGGSAKLAARGIYQFRGSAGERITIVNKEKLRTATAGVSNKGKK